MAPCRETLFSSVPPSNFLISVLDTSRDFVEEHFLHSSLIAKSQQTNRPGLLLNRPAPQQIAALTHPSLHQHAINAKKIPTHHYITIRI